VTKPKNNPEIKKGIRHQSGSILFPLLISISITAMSVFYFYFNSFQMRKLEDQKLVHVSNLTALENSARALLNSQGPLMASAQLAANGNFFRCLNDPEFNCNVATPQNFTLLSADGSTFLDPTNPSQGLDSGMQTCTSFPSLSCPFRYELKWYSQCIGFGPCYSPDLIIQGRLVVGDLPSVKFNINPVNYSFEVKVR
jgi:hypothetical protein